MARDLIYLAAVVWFSRRGLAGRVSISIGVGFCIEVVEKALGNHGALEISSSGQDSQFKGMVFTGLLRGNGIDIRIYGGGHGATTASSSGSGGPSSARRFNCTYDSVSDARASIGNA